MRCPPLRAMACVLFFLSVSLTTVPCRAALFYYRPTFVLGSQATTVIDFEGLAGPPANFTSYPSGLATSGAQFTGEVPGLPPEPSLFVIDPLYSADYDRGSEDVLSPGTPDGKLVFDLPAGTMAVGFDVVTFGAPSDNRAFVVASSGGTDPVLQFAQAEGPASERAFVGFTSATPIVRVTITPSAAAITLIDNVRFGQISPALVAGDANGDGLVDAADYTPWADHYLQVGRSFDQGDFNADGIVDGGDYTHWADNYSKQNLLTSTATPEPSTLVLAIVGAAISIVKAVRVRRIHNAGR